MSAPFRPVVTDALELYDRAARESSVRVIRRYSTSFGAATRMLPPPLRGPIRAIYALVRIADEVVDGTAAAAGLDIAQQTAQLDALEAETESGMKIGFSTNLVVHDFARVARWAGFGAELTRPFFASMRRDLDPEPLGADEFGPYVHGSAEVVGLMCLQCFLVDEPEAAARLTELEEGARRLGSAFQKVNFLRDLGSDWHLGRSYFPGIDPRHLTADEKEALLADINADLTAAKATLPLLPRSSRPAVTAAHGLFSRLAARIRATPEGELLETRVRVPDAEKIIIAARARFTGRTP